MVWCGVVWCGVVWCGVVWCGVMWCDAVWCGVVWCGVVWCGVTGRYFYSISLILCVAMLYYVTWLGDMQLTRQEVLESQLLVTTPEKYDVVTRKGGDGSLGTLVNLIIIDEVHLLAEDRGAVLETIVARTQRYIESSQHMV